MSKNLIFLSVVAGASALAFALVFSAFEKGKNPRMMSEMETASMPDPHYLLLTGFEPFMGSALNASWEGVRSLEGSVVAGCTVVVKRLNVIWGAPMESLRPEIKSGRYRAVISFGQGHPGMFRIETVANNFRKPLFDNAGTKGSGPFVEGGPQRYPASAPAAELAAALAAKGWPVETSDNAGSYLCEEALYTLEHLRATLGKPKVVLFCHVPPLGTQDVKGGTVSAELIARFIAALVEKALGK